MKDTKLYVSDPLVRNIVMNRDIKKLRQEMKIFIARRTRIDNCQIRTA